MQTLTDLLQDSSHGKLRGLALGACFDDIVALEGEDFRDDRKKSQLIRYSREPSDHEDIEIAYNFDDASLTAIRIHYEYTYEDSDAPDLPPDVDLFGFVFGHKGLKVLHRVTRPLLTDIVAHYEGLYGEAEKTSRKRGVSKIETFSWTFDGHFLEVDFFADTCNETGRVWQTFRVELSVDD